MSEQKILHETVKIDRDAPEALMGSARFDQRTKAPKDLRIIRLVCFGLFAVWVVTIGVMIIDYASHVTPIETPRPRWVPQD